MPTATDEISKELQLFAGPGEDAQKGPLVVLSSVAGPTSKIAPMKDQADTRVNHKT